MDKRTNKKISDYIASIAEQNHRLLKAYLFGSYARHLDKPESDIDVALVIENLDDDEKFDLQVQLMLLASNFDSRIEPHPVSSNDFDSSNPFISEIKKTGIEIEPRTPNTWYNK
ncbi:MAG: nucleotidyltransferase domain-containing protein [Bacteroidales bacterium]|nr:nucleotidyltransferase domain-containing protein [Bacteroidales bacterium]